MAKFEAIKKNLEILDCPLLGNGEDWWIKDLLITPGQYKIQILEWLLTKLDTNLKQTICAGIGDDVMPVATKRMSALLTSLGLNRKGECGLSSNTSSTQQQLLFWRHITEVAVLHQIHKTDSDAQFKNSCTLIDTIAEQGKLPDLFDMEINLLPPDLTKEIAEGSTDDHSSASPSMCDVKKQLEDVDDALSKETTHFNKLQSEFAESTANCETTQEQLNNVLTDFSRLCIAFSETYNSLKPWFNREEPELVQFGQKLQVICSQSTERCNFMDTLATVTHCCLKLNELKDSMRKDSMNKMSFGSKIKELNNMLQSIVEFNKEYSVLANSTLTSI